MTSVTMKKGTGTAGLDDVVPWMREAMYQEEAVQVPWRAGGPALAVRERPPRAAKLRVYIDTSVFGGYVEDKFRGPSRRLIDRCRRGEVTLVLSDVTTDELQGAPPHVRAVLASIDAENLEMVVATPEVEALATRYIESAALSKGMKTDALHIAAATVHGVDVLVSWNFRHIVNPRRIAIHDDVNRRLGYTPVTINNPGDLEDDE